MADRFLTDADIFGAEDQTGTFLSDEDIFGNAPAEDVALEDRPPVATRSLPDTAGFAPPEEVDAPSSLDMRRDQRQTAAGVDAPRESPPEEDAPAVPARGQAMLDAEFGRGIGWDQYQRATGQTGRSVTSAPEPDPDDPFAGESAGDLLSRRGQQFSRGATEVVASVPEASAVASAAAERERASGALKLRQERAATINDIEAKLADPSLDANTRRILERNLSDLRIGQAELAERSTREIVPAQDRDRFKRGAKIREASEGVFGAPDPRDTSFWAQVAEGGGNMTALALTSVASSVVGGPVAGLGVGAGLGAGMNTSQLYKEAIEAGASVEVAEKAAKWGAVIGASEIVPINRALKLLPPRLRGQITNGVLRRFSDVAQGAGEEAAQEYLATVANNIVAQQLYDPERGWTEGATEAALVGAVLGGVIGGAGSLAGGDTPPVSRPPAPRRDRERLDSPRLTPADRASPIPNDVIDDGKAALEEIVAQSGAPTSPAAGVQPESSAPDAAVPTASQAPPVPPTEAMRQGADVDIPEGAVPFDDVFGGFDRQETTPEQPVPPIVTERPPVVAPAGDAETAPAEPAGVPITPPTSTELTDENIGLTTKPEPTLPGGRDIEVLSNEAIQGIETDAETFQYKGGADTEGVTDRLQDVQQWDSNRTGIGLVYEYADGRRVIADGHQRLGLAKRMAAKGQRVDFPVRILREVDGVSPRDARAIAAEKNIAEGSGTALDAAKVFRDTRKTARDLNLPMSSTMVKSADNLAQLSDDAFGMVNNGVASERDGAIVGQLVKDEGRHSDILGLLTRLNPPNITQAQSIVQQAQQTEVRETQTSLFGEEEVSANLYLERARILDKAVKDLGKQISTFRVLRDRGDTITEAGNVLNQDANSARVDADTMARESLLRQANTKGPISDALTEAARAFKDGESLSGAARRFIASVQGADSDGAQGRPQAGPSGDGDGSSQADGQERPGLPAGSVQQEPQGVTGTPTARPGADLFDNGDNSQPGERQTDLEDLIAEANQRPTTPESTGPDATFQTRIGTNARGDALFEDENGVRSYLTDNGARVTEGVSIIPGQGFSVDPSRRGNEYQTPEEFEQAEADRATQAEFDRIDAAKKAAQDAAPKPDLTSLKDVGGKLNYTDDTARITQTQSNGAKRNFRAVRFWDDAAGAWRIRVTRSTDLSGVQGQSGAPVTNPPDKNLGTFDTAADALKAMQGDGLVAKSEPTTVPDDTAPDDVAGFTEGLASKAGRAVVGGIEYRVVDDNDNGGFRVIVTQQSPRNVRDLTRMNSGQFTDKAWTREDAIEAAQRRAFPDRFKDDPAPSAAPDDGPEKSWVEAKTGDLLRGPGNQKKFKVRGKIKKWEADGLARKVRGYRTLDGDLYGVVGPKSLTEQEVRKLLEEVRAERGQDSETAPAPATSTTPARGGPTFSGDRADSTSNLTEDEKDRLAELKAKMRQKFRNQINSGLDPEMVAIAVEMGSIYVKAGARRFRDLLRAMMEDLGVTFDQAQPYARNAYNQVRDDMELDGESIEGMDSAADVLAEVKAMRDGARAESAGSTAETKPTYIFRPVLNSDAIRAWAASQGFKTTLPPEEMHVTQIYAKEPVDRGQPALQPRSDTVVSEGGRRVVETLGDEGAVVLTFTDSKLSQRWDELKEAGAKSDFQTYKAHVTLTYKPGNVDLSNVEPYRGPIEFGPETLEDIDGNFDPSEIKEVTTSAIEAENSPQMLMKRLVDGFQKAFADGAGFDNINQARRRYEEFTGEPYDASKAKALEEAIEVAVVKQARVIAAEFSEEPGRAYERMVDLYSRQPKLAQRTSTSIEMQAYSTPAPLAYLASRLARIGPNTKVYEPSAGNGMLLMEADPGNVTANEMQPDRAENLRAVLGDEATITVGDAMQATLPRDYDRFVANPPFGKVFEDGGSKVFDLAGMEGDTKEIDHAIVAKGLEGLSDGGRAVLIIGGQKGATPDKRKAEYIKGESRKFFKKLYDTYNVVEHFTADGKLYERQGAGWPVDVIVIKGAGKSALPYPMKQAPVLYSDWDAIGERLNGKDSLDTRGLDDGSGDSRDGATEQAPDAGSVPGGAIVADRPDGDGGRGPRAGAPDADGGGERSPVSGGEPADSGRRPGVRLGVAGGTDGDAGPAVANSPGADQAGVGPEAGGTGGGFAGGISEPSVPRQRVERDNTEAETSFQVQYEPTSNARFSVGTLVPKNMQQAMSRALSDLESRVGDIDAYVGKKLGYSLDEMLGTAKKNGYFSAEQMDALALAIDNVEQGKGFIIGDQTGVGKGRFVAAMLRYAARNGMQPVFVTKDAALFKAMIRDMRDIGMDDAHKTVFMTDPKLRGKDVIPLSQDPTDTMASPTPSKLKKALSDISRTGILPTGYDMMFTTYSQMQQVEGKTTPRMDAIRAMAPNAMFVLDESHEAGGGQQKNRGKKDEEKIPRSQFIREVLADSRGAVFSSATYAKNPAVLSLYAKTDLSLAVDKIEDLEKMIVAGGVPLQQIMANMLVESGQYARRERSYEGVEMNLEQLLTDKTMANRGAEVIRALFNLDRLVMEDVRAAFIEGAEAEGMAGVVDGAVGNVAMDSTSFSSTMHNLAAQFLLAIKVDAVIEDAIKLHKSGRKPIIALSNTNASILSESAEEAGKGIGDEFNVPFNNILERYLDRLRRITLKDENDNKFYIYLTDDQIAQFGGPEALSEFKKAQDFIRTSNLEGLPGSPIDTILDRLNAAGINADEITGRQVTLRDGIIQKRESSPAAKTRVMDAYNRGDLDALVINRSGSTGFSMHATDKPGNDGKKRHMIILQPEPNIDTFMQMLGRIHRTGQTELPGYTIAVSDLSVEKRPAAVLMRKMASLSANTTASKKSAVSLDNVTDFLNKYGDQIVYQYLMENPTLAMEVGITPNKKFLDGLAAKFTGKLVSLPPDEVTRIYDEIEGNYRDYIDALDRMGQNALEAKVQELDARTIDETQIVEAKDESSPFGQAAFIQTVDVKRLGKPMTPDQIEEATTAALGGKSAEEFADGQIDALGDILTDQKQKLQDRLEKAQETLAEAKTEKQKDAAQDRINRLIEDGNNLTGAFQNVSAMLRTFAPGKVGTLSNGDESFAAVALGVDTKRVTTNATAGSAMTVRIAIADAGREVPLPLSRFIGESPEYTWSEVSDRQRAAVIQAFADGQSESRETRQMITGNIPAGFDQMKKGQITLYTDDQGNLKQGIMLPKTFSATAALQNRPVKMNPDQVIEFLEDGDFSSRVVNSEDGTLAVSFNGSQYGFFVLNQGSKKYTLNKQVREIVGDFEKRNGAKGFRKTPTRAELRRILTIYSENLGTEYSTTVDRAVARRITGEEIPDIPEIDGNQGPIKKARPTADVAAAAGIDPKFSSTEADGRVVVQTTPRAQEMAKAVARDMREEMRKIGVNDVPVRVVERLLAGSPTEGVTPLDGMFFMQAITVALDASRTPVEIVRHEAIHALRSPTLWGSPYGAFKPAEWKALQSHVLDDLDRMNLAREFYPNESEDGVIEEAIADLYADWSLGRTEAKGFVGAALKRIRSVMEAIRNALRGNGFITANQVFQKISDGDIAARSRPTGAARREPPLTKPRFAKRQEDTDTTTSTLIGEEVENAVNHATSQPQREEGFLRALATQPVDMAFRIPFAVLGGLDKAGRWKWGKAAEARIRSVMVDRHFRSGGAFDALNPLIERVRSGMLDRYGLPEDYVELERSRGVQESMIAAEGKEHIEALMNQNMSPAEAKVLQAVLTGEAVPDEAMDRIAAPIRKAIDDLGSEAVELGLISRESYDRNRGTYLHRVYAKHEMDDGAVARWATALGRNRRKKIIGNQFKGRGIFEEADTATMFRGNEEFQKAQRGKPQKGDKVIILDLRTTTGTDGLPTVDGPKGRLKRRIYWPADRAIPSRFDNYENRGVFEVRGEKGKNTILWRDFTKAERLRMGEILDARYTIAKTYAQMAHDLATGRMFKKIAENEDWARKMPPEDVQIDEDPEFRSGLKRMWINPDVAWVQVPKSKIPKSNTYRYGALAGMYVRSEIWRDMEELRIMQTPNFWGKLLTQWKLNKTARNPVVHTNNVMSNFMLMDMADVRAPDLIKGIAEMARGGPVYEEAAAAGAFGADMVTQEIRDNVLKPMLEELRKEIRQGQGGMEAEIGTIGKVADALFRGARAVDRKMINLYQAEDQVFRMATYIRRRQQGYTVAEAAIEARDQFLNYDIRAPWVNAARRSVLPFISYTYRAVPKLAQTFAERPWKIAKYAAIYQALNMMAYAVAPSDYDEEEERGSLRDQEQGMTWVGTERLVRMPWTSGDNPVFLDVRRWIPAGDVFDMSQGDVPPWLQVGGPLTIGAELYLNKTAFTQEEVFNPLTDTFGERMQKRADFLYKSWMPSAPWVPGSWYWQKIKRAAFDEALQFGSNEPYSTGEALASSFGLKVKPVDVETGYMLHGFRFDRVERELNTQRTMLRRQRARRLISEKEYQGALDTILEKRERLMDRREETFDKRN